MNRNTRTIDILDKFQFHELIEKVKPNEIYFLDRESLYDDDEHPFDIGVFQKKEILANYDWGGDDSVILYIYPSKGYSKISAPEDSSYLFSSFDCDALKRVSVLDLCSLDTSGTKNFDCFFKDFGIEKYYLYIDNLPNLNLSNAISASEMFCNFGNNFSDFRFLFGIQNWETQNIQYMDKMFYKEQKLLSNTIPRNYPIDLSNWNVEKVKSHDNFVNGTTMYYIKEPQWKKEV